MKKDVKTPQNISADQPDIQTHILFELSQVKSSDALSIAHVINQPITAVFLALDTLAKSGRIYRPTPDQYALCQEVPE